MLIFSFVFILSVFIALIIPSVYRSYSTIMIEEQHIPSDFVMKTVSTFAEQRVENIKQRVLSFTQLWDIITEYNLYSGLREKLTPEEVVAKMRSDVSVRTVSAEVFDPRTGRPATVTTSFVVAYEGKNPRAVLRVTDTLTSVFLQQNLEFRQQRITDTSNFLAEEAERVQGELATADGKVAQFKQEHVKELPELFQVNVQGLNSLERKIELLQADLGSLKEKESYLVAQLSSTTPSMSAVDEKNQNVQMIKELKMQLSQLQQRYTDEYPDIVVLKNQIKNLQAESAVNGNEESGNGMKQATSVGIPDNPAYVALKSQLASTRSDIASVKEQITAFEKQCEDYRQRIEATPRVEEVYVSLVNQRNSLQAKYNDLLQKHQEAKVAQELEKDQKGERFTLIEPARLPEKPSKPNRLAIVLVGFVLAAGSSVGLAAIKEFMDSSVYSADALESLTGGPVLAAMPIIVTPQEKKQKKIRLIFLCIGSIVLLFCAIAVFHYFVMDLDIFLAKVFRRLDRL